MGSIVANAPNKFNIWNELGRAGAHALAQGGFFVPIQPDMLIK